jgi:hypothetical protein
MFVAPAVLTFVGPPFIESDYLKFIRKDQAYYTRVSKACEDLLSRNPLGTNSMLEIPIKKATIPEILRKLHPSDISVLQEGLHLRMHKGSRVGFYAVSWVRDTNKTNIWRLQAGGGEAPVVVVYAITNL